MTITTQYVRRVGGSLMVTIPGEIAAIEQIFPGEIVEVEIHKIKKDWFGVFKGIKSMKKNEKLNIHD